MNQVILLPNEMFQDDTDINCFNLAVETKEGVQYWDVDRFIARHPRMGQMLIEAFKADKRTVLVRRGLFYVGLVLV